MRPGKADGYERRALGWIRYAERTGYDAIIFVIDQDGDLERQPQLDKVQGDQRTEFRRALGVAIKTFDAWMLADETALSAGLVRQIQPQPDPETLADPKSVCRSLCAAGEEPAARLTELYSAIAQAVRIEALERRCPKGFVPFANRVRAL